MALPVVDYDGKFLGVVTHDDVMDIIHEEASEDMLGMVGAGRDETVDTPWRQSVFKRMPWLVVNLCNSTLAAYVVHHYEGTIEQMAILAALMPMVTNQGGNTGQQSLAVSSGRWPWKNSRANAASWPLSAKSAWAWPMACSFPAGHAGRARPYCTPLPVPGHGPVPVPEHAPGRHCRRSHPMILQNARTRSRQASSIFLTT